jgi:hypothetical protein
MEAYSSDDAREDWMPSCENLALFDVWSDVFECLFSAPLGLARPAFAPDLCAFEEPW